MIIKSYSTWKNYDNFKGEIVDGVSFLVSDQIVNVYDACCGDIDKLINMFKIVGVKFDHINVMMKSCISYSVDGLDLTLADLSSGERFVLYLLACKKLKEEVLAIGLFEILGSRLMNVVYEELRDYENLTILLFNTCLDLKFNPYMEAIV
mgnify:CR=1 FL=1